MAFNSPDNTISLDACICQEKGGTENRPLSHIGDLLAVRVGHRGAVAVAVVGVAHRLAVGLGDGVAEGVRLAGEVAERVVGIILLEVRQGNSPVPLF